MFFSHSTIFFPRYFFSIADEGSHWVLHLIACKPSSDWTGVTSIWQNITSPTLGFLQQLQWPHSSGVSQPSTGIQQEILTVIERKYIVFCWPGELIHSCDHCLREWEEKKMRNKTAPFGNHPHIRHNAALLWLKSDGCPPLLKKPPKTSIFC